MANPIVSVGSRFGRLVTVKDLGCTEKKRWWLVRCDCGNEKRVRQSSLQYQFTKSCGCLARELTVRRSTTHGESAGQGKGIPLTAEYRTWRGLFTRCENEKAENYPDYGGRGITVCERWRGKNGFMNFLTDMGRRPGKGWSIERRDINGDYFPENCRWATATEQANNKRMTVLIEFDGRKLTATQWEREMKYRDGLIRDRLNRGWSAEDAIKTPTGKIGRWSRVH